MAQRGRPKKNLEYSQTIFDDAPHFKEVEFCKVGCHKSDMQPATLRRLERLREIVNEPLILSSAYRTPYHEQLKGRPTNGAHTLGCAVDLVCDNNLLRYKIVAAAVQVGFNRIGIGKNFIHLDDSNVHNSPRIWTYYN